MNNLGNLSINKKIHLITGLTIILLIAILVISRNTMVDNEKSINEIASVSYEVVKYATANKYLVQNLDELYRQAVTFGHISRVRKVKLQLVFTNSEWESFHPAGCRRVDTDSVHPVTRVDRETCIQHMGVIETWSYNQANVTQ